VDALPIVIASSTAAGLIMPSCMRFSSSSSRQHLRASLVSLAMVRELGPIMTRSLSQAGPARPCPEIGTMKISDEVDALHGF